MTKKNTTTTKKTPYTENLFVYVTPKARQYTYTAVKRHGLTLSAYIDKLITEDKKYARQSKRAA